MWRLVLLPLTDVDVLNPLCRSLSEILGVECSVGSPPPMPLNRFYVVRRGQYNSTLILAYLRRSLVIGGSVKVLAVADFDAFAGNLNFVFGEAEYNGSFAVIYLPRLRHRVWEIYFKRVVKEALHELGHTFGLSHCGNRRCVMSFSNSIYDVDYKEASFCGRCAHQLSRRGVTVDKRHVLPGFRGE